MDIVRLLPDSVANQIAAGEVIQRPASVIKELVENSIDAGATLVNVLVKTAGRTLIQVVDNGKGMSTTDARMAFERHATSKIREACDLFSLSTMGFRGEALASIAAVARVELRTATEGAPLGTLIEIEGSQVTRQEMVQCPIGSNFIVKDLFFNVPARRKFLKKDETELRNIIQEMQRIALAHTSVAFTLHSDGELIYDLPIGSFKQRIVDVFARRTRNIESQLIDIHTDTSIVRVDGFVSSPQGASRNAHNYFFVNDRYMNHPYFRRAVISAFDGMLRADEVPMFFISLHVDPNTIDVNIHPTKTEIKFENEREIWQILLASIKESLGKFNIIPSLDFDSTDRIEIPTAHNRGNNEPMPEMPRIASFDASYNPFGQGRKHSSQDNRNWQQLFEKSSHAVSSDTAPHPTLFSSCSNQPLLPFDMADTSDPAVSDYSSLLHDGRYIVVSMGQSLYIVDVCRAMSRILYDDMMRMVENHSSVGQKLLFPEIVELSPDDACLFNEIEVELANIGFEISPFGKNLYRIESIPALLPECGDTDAIVHRLLARVKAAGSAYAETLNQLIADTISGMASLSKPAVASPQERSSILGRLFASSNPNYTPSGEKIIATVTQDLVANLFRI